MSGDNATPSPFPHRELPMNACNINLRWLIFAAISFFAIAAFVEALAMWRYSVFRLSGTAAG